MENKNKIDELQEYMNIGFKRGYDKGRTQAISEFKEKLKEKIKKNRYINGISEEHIFMEMEETAQEIK
jgi:hypothetical protein